MYIYIFEKYIRKLMFSINAQKLIDFKKENNTLFLNFLNKKGDWFQPSQAGVFNIKIK